MEFLHLSKELPEERIRKTASYKLSILTELEKIKKHKEELLKQEALEHAKTIKENIKMYEKQRRQEKSVFRRHIQKQNRLEYVAHKSMKIVDKNRSFLTTKNDPLSTGYLIPTDEKRVKYIEDLKNDMKYTLKKQMQEKNETRKKEAIISANIDKEIKNAAERSIIKEKEKVERLKESIMETANILKMQILEKNSRPKLSMSKYEKDINKVLLIKAKKAFCNNINE